MAAGPTDANLTSLSRAYRWQRLFRDLWAGPRGTFSAAWEDEIRRDPTLREARVVVDVVLGAGVRLRMATETMTFERTHPEAVDDVIAVLGLLNNEPNLNSNYTMGTGGSSARSFGLSLGMPRFNPWEWIRTHKRFLAGWAEVSIIVPGMKWEDRFVFMRGDLDSGVMFGTLAEQIDVSVTDPLISADIGITEYVIDESRFSDLPDNYTGDRIPLAINSPPKVPAIRVQATVPPIFLVCYGHEHQVTQVFVDEALHGTGSAVWPHSITYRLDDQGVPYTAIEFSAGTGVWADNTTVYASLAPRDDIGRTRPLIDTLRWLCESWSLLGPVGVSQPAFARAEARSLGTVAPDVFINGSGDQDAARALSYIESTITGSFPMLSMSWQPGGYGPVLTERRRSSVAKWVVGQGPVFKRITDWQETAKGELFNWFTFRYNYNPLEDVFEGVITRNPNNSALCRISEEQAGPRDMDPIESKLINDDDDAEWVVGWLENHRTLPSYYAEYPCAPWVVMKHGLGQNIDLVDEEIHDCDFDNPVTATIEKLDYVRGQAIIGFRIWALYDSIDEGRAESPKDVDEGG